ncbi:MAG: hypothetical protein WC026_16080 [Hyphomicrobium sp.]|uniref:hypothetical protein n=1 Tax=Hyphomicrobium sp. TaxID=82 RepID=UPI003562ECAB
MSEELISRMQVAISGLPTDKLASFHARFIAYLEAGLCDDLRVLGDVEFGDCDARALQVIWRERRP